MNNLMLGWKYRNWLKALAGANFVTGKDILEGKISLDTCNFFLYHDMDSAGIEEHLYPTIRIEEELGICSTTYLLVDDRVNPKQGEYFTYFPRESYYKKNLKELLKLQDSGFEFGYHVNATGRCKRIGNTVDPEEAYRILIQDINWFKEQGFNIRTMSAHGFKWFDNVRSGYDNYQLEYDATERGCPAVSQYHLSKKFLEAGGRRIEDLKDVTFGKTIWKKWHTIKVEDCISLLMDDSCGNWQQLSIEFLAKLIPHLKGCLMRILTHPVSWDIVDGELEYKNRAVSLRDGDVEGV